MIRGSSSSMASAMDAMNARAESMQIGLKFESCGSKKRLIRFRPHPRSGIPSQAALGELSEKIPESVQPSAVHLTIPESVAAASRKRGIDFNEIRKSALNSA